MPRGTRWPLCDVPRAPRGWPAAGMPPSGALSSAAYIVVAEVIMRATPFIVARLGLVCALGTPAFAQRGAASSAADSTPDPIRELVGRLDLEKYKSTIKGLTQFGDRRQGTDRNRAAVDWIEAQLKSYGCPPERLKYEYYPPDTQGRGRAGGGRGPDQAQGGGRLRGI